MSRDEFWDHFRKLSNVEAELVLQRAAAVYYRDGLKSCVEGEGQDFTPFAMVSQELPTIQKYLREGMEYLEEVKARLEGYDNGKSDGA